MASSDRTSLYRSVSAVYLGNGSIRHSANKGKIELEYYGNDDLQRILELLGADEG